VNCAQFVVANAISNSPQKKRERTHYAHPRQKKFARPALRDFAPSRPRVRLLRAHALGELHCPSPPGLFNFCSSLFNFKKLCGKSVATAFRFLLFKERVFGAVYPQTFGHFHISNRNPPPFPCFQSPPSKSPAISRFCVQNFSEKARRSESRRAARMDFFHSLVICALSLVIRAQRGRAAFS
jgi:hypothetical protein